MKKPSAHRPLPQTQSIILVILLLLLLVFARGQHLFYGALLFVLLGAYHVLTDHRYGAEQIKAAGLLIPHIILYLLLCTMLIASTTTQEESPFWIVYFLPIAVAGANLRILGTLLTCAAAALLFLSQLPRAMFLHQEGLKSEIPELMVLFLGFFLLGTLINSFSLRSRRQLEAQVELNSQLLEQQKALQDSLQRLEEAEEGLRRQERLAAMGTLAAGLAHEIRNPLGIVSSSVQLLRRKLPDAPENTSQLVDIVQEEINRLDRLVNDFLAFGRPAAPQLRPANLSNELAALVEQYRPLAAEKNIQLVLVKSDEPLIVSVDPQQMRQVFYNLLLNALDATPGGIITVEEKKCDDGVRITVSDTGQGIAPELQERIFDPFFTTKDHGTGLGLANASRIVENHGGKLSVSSSTEGGASFEIYFPSLEQP